MCWIKIFLHICLLYDFQLPSFPIYDSDIVILSFLSSSNQPNAFLLTIQWYSRVYVKHMSLRFIWMTIVQCPLHRLYFLLHLCFTERKKAREIGKGKKRKEKEYGKSSGNWLEASLWTVHHSEFFSVFSIFMKYSHANVGGKNNWKGQKFSFVKNSILV